MVFLPGGAGLGGYDVAPNFSATKNYASVTKLALSIDRIDRTATQIRRAFHTARQGRPGPVVVEMHGDVLGQQAPRGRGGTLPAIDDDALGAVARRREGRRQGPVSMRSVP